MLVYGDTNSTLAGARAGVARGIPVAHVEAGLRSGDLSMPEERNRIEVDRVATLLLAPDERSRATLVHEGVPGRTEVVGDVMADATMQLAPIARGRSRILDELELAPAAYVVATVHREANVQPDRLRRIAAGFNRLAEPIVFPAHPRTAHVLVREGIALGDHVLQLPPLGYLEFAALASQARAIATDSGGLQKEAYWYGVPCVTLRDTTEWPETVEAGWNVLVGTDRDAIVAAVRDARRPDQHPRLYGDGRASERIAELLYTIPRR